MSTIRAANLALMFALEVAVYVGAAAYALSSPFPLPARLALAVAAVGSLAAIWGLLASPKAPYPVRGAGRLLVEFGWFGCGAAAMAAIGWTVAGVALAVLWAINGALRVTWDQTNIVTAPSRTPSKEVPWTRPGSSSTAPSARRSPASPGRDSASACSTS